MKTIMVFQCRDCSTQFSALGIRSHPVRFCPDCRKIHLRLHNQDNREYRAARHKRVYRLDKAPYEVVRHDDPAWFRPGAHFSGQEFKELVTRGYVDGMVVRHCGRHGGEVMVVRSGKLEEVK